MFAFNLESVVLTERPTPNGSIRFEFPLHSGLGTASTAAVLFELDPGNELATHMDSAEEVLLVLEGEGEVHVDGETVRVRAGDVALVPAMAPHGARAVGDSTLRVIGFFSSSTVVSTFEQPIGPEGERLHVTGSVQPFLAEVPEPAALAV
jgi:quercetin dioxygenase-like cupin family protein